MCIEYQGSFDVIVLQASPEQTKKQQEDADRVMKKNHEQKAKLSRNQRREAAARPEEILPGLP